MKSPQRANGFKTGDPRTLAAGKKGRDVNTQLRAYRQTRTKAEAK